MIKGCLLAYQRFPSQFSHQNWASNLTSQNCELISIFRHFTIQFHEFQEPQWYKCWNHKFWVFSARKWQVRSHIYRVPPKRRLFSPVRTQVLTCPKMAVRKRSRAARTVTGRESSWGDQGHFRRHFGHVLRVWIVWVVCVSRQVLFLRPTCSCSGLSPFHLQLI